MKKKLLGAILAGVLAFSTMSPVTALADSQKVVTLGADLSEEQKNAVMRYFGVNGQNVQILTITNADERQHLGAYVPLEQIGTRTFSCALVNPTNSGGIQVKTANLLWVTGNMIASTLSTCGVKNCEVLAASPFAVSGTGALTGIIMAYESASGETLDETKKELATEELVTTGTIADQIGQQQATNIVNEIKIQVIEGQVADYDLETIEDIVADVVEEVAQSAPEEVTVSLSEADRQLLVDLATKIAEQDYDYEEMRETLERVESNVSDISSTVSDIAATPAPAQPVVPAEPVASAEPSIFADMDTDAFGADVVQTTTDETEAQPETMAEAAPEQEMPFDITTSEETIIDIENPQQPAEIIETPVEQPADIIETPVEQPAEIVETPVEQIAETPEEPVVEAMPLVLGEVKLFPEETNDYGETVNTTGLNTIRIDVQNANIVPVSGALVVKDSFGNEVKRVDLSDANQIVAEAASNEVLFLNNWMEGTSIYVNVGNAFNTTAEDQYKVEVDAMVANSESMDTQAQLIADTTLTLNGCGITFSTNAAADLEAGKTATGNIVMDPEKYASAEIIGTTGLIDFDAYYFTQDGLYFNAVLNNSGVEEITIAFTLYDETTETYTFYVPVC